MQHLFNCVHVNVIKHLHLPCPHHTEELCQKKKRINQKQWSHDSAERCQSQLSVCQRLSARGKRRKKDSSTHSWKCKQVSLLKSSHSHSLRTKDFVLFQCRVWVSVQCLQFIIFLLMCRKRGLGISLELMRQVY